MSHAWIWAALKQVTLYNILCVLPHYTPTFIMHQLSFFDRKYKGIMDEKNLQMHGFS